MLAEKYVSPKMWAILRENFPERNDEELKIQVEEFLKFMTIISAEGASFIPLSKEIDDIWHEFILQTASYAKFCDNLLGQRFIHHETISMEDYSAQKGKGVLVDQMLKWIPHYIKRYGDFTDRIADYWTMCRFLQNELGMTLAEINELGQEQAKKIKIAVPETV